MQQTVQLEEWSDDSHDDSFFSSGATTLGGGTGAGPGGPNDSHAATNGTQGPSLSYERKIRLHKYAENRARSCLGLLNESSHVLWKMQDTKQEVALFKPSSEWSELVSAKAVVYAHASFPNVLKTIYDLKTSEKLKLFLRKVLGELFLDAEVLEDLNTTGMYPSAKRVTDPSEMYKQASIKWWAIKSGSIVSKSSDFYVLEYIGIEMVNGEIDSCYLFQESLAEVGGMPHIQGNNLERSHIDSLICRFQRAEATDEVDEHVIISIAFQRPPPLVSLFRGNPAMEMVFQLAKGLRDLLEDPPEPQEISVVKTSAWVKDRERSRCFICLKKFSPLFRRRHHCRTCGEVICWQCSTTIRVPSISFTHNDSGKQVLSRHQPSIRLCTKCVVSHHRSKSSNELSNQDEFKEWMHRHTSGDDGAKHGPQSPSHSQDLTGVMEDPSVEKSDDIKPQRDSKFGYDDEVKEEDNSTDTSVPEPVAPLPGPSLKAVDIDRGNQDETGREEGEDDEYRLASESRRSHSRIKSHSSSQIYQLGQNRPHSIENLYPQPTSISGRHSGDARPSSHLRRVRRSHSDINMGNAIRTTGVSNIGSNRARESQPHRALESVGSFQALKNSRNIQPSNAYVQDDLAFSMNQRGSVTDELLLQNASCVHAASAWSTSQTEVAAMTSAFQELLTKLGGDVHFVVVGFSTGFSPDKIVDLLRQLAPGVPYIGGTIARGMCDENAWVSVNRHNDEGLVTLWGVNDPHGIYSVVHTEYAQSDAREKTFAATKTAFARLAADIDPGEKPSFVSVYACPLFVEHAIEGIREAVHCPIIGGCSSDAAKHRENGEVSVSWIQISSSSSSDYTKSVRDGRGDWTEMGIAYALCFPSVETYVSWFSGYSPVGVGNDYCMGTVTKASNKTIYEIDCRPAADVYNEWLDVVAEKSNADFSTMGFPRLGNLHPLGTVIDVVAGQKDHETKIEEISSRSSSCSMQSSAWSKLINMTAVITAINEDGSLSTTSSIASGTSVLLMETSAQSLKTAINKMGAQAIQNSKFHVHEIVGCLMFLSAGVQALLGHKSMAEMVGAYKDWSGGASLMGMTTFGEIGHLPQTTDFPHYDSLMFGAVIFSKRKRKEYLYF